MNSLESHLQAQIECSEHFFWHRLRWRAVKRVLAAEPPTAVADIGAGAGLLGHYLAQEYPNTRYKFEEPLTSLEQSLIRRFGAEANVRGHPRIDADVVVLLDVLEHQEDDRHFLHALLTRMKPGARLVMTVPAMSMLWSPWDVQLGHYRRYTRRSVRSVLTGMPTVIEEISYLFPELVAPALVRKLISKPTVTSGATEFPELPSTLDSTLYRLGLGTQQLRKIVPFGSSVFAVAARP